MAYSLHCGNAVPAVNRDFRVLCPEAFYFASQVCILFPLSHCGAGPCALAAAAEHQSVLTASALHRGLPMACISKRVCKLSVVCSHLRKKKTKNTTEKPYLQHQIQVTHLCSQDLFRHVPSKKEGCGHLW